MGLGLDAFLNHNKDGGGGRKFLNWKEKGSAIVWLSTRASPAYVSWNHPFSFRDVVEDKDTGKEKEILRFGRFVSPDPEIVHSSQYFRDDNDRLKVPPIADPFLLLREWLRLECDLPLDTVIFEWENPKTGEVTQWRRGNLARLVEKSRATAYHTLDTKLEYLFVVADDASPGDGLQIVRGPKLLGDKMKEAIGQEMDSNGERGNPLLHPYAFRWIFDKNARSPMDSYKAFRYNQARLTEEIRAAITNPEFPDPDPDCKPRPGDKAKIRAAMEDAARVNLPWDRIFVPAWKDEDPTDFNYGHNAKGGGGGEVSGGRRETSAASENRQADRPSEAGPKTRRKKKEEPKPPEPARIPCDDCGFMMLPTDTKCAKCGAEYEVEADAGSATAPPAAATAPKTSGQTSDGKCWSCGGRVVADRCADCGLDVTDDLPFG